MQIIKRKSLLILVSLSGTIAFLFYWNSFTDFDPIIFEDGYYRKMEVNAAFYENLKAVFDQYKVEYKIDEQGKILVKRSLYADKESILNYTKKALDTAWLDSHRSFE